MYIFFSISITCFKKLTKAVFSENIPKSPEREAIHLENATIRFFEEVSAFSKGEETASSQQQQRRRRRESYHGTFNIVKRKDGLPNRTQWLEEATQST
jgi:hypothetical protein